MTVCGCAKIMATVYLMAASINASAIDCNQESPGFAQDRDAYFEIDEPGPVTARQQSRITNLFSAFEGKRLKGKGVSFECVGPERSAKKLYTKYAVTAEIQQRADGQLVIGIESVDEKKTAARNETLKYFGRNNPFHIIELSGNELVISARLRLQKVLHEHVVEISVRNDSLMINETRYRNGYFAVQRTMSLGL